MVMLTKKQSVWLALIVGIVFFAIYAMTAQRGVSWQDSGEFQYRLLTGDYAWNSGIARAHPLYILLGRGFIAVFPVSLKLYACSLFSGFWMATALALLFYLVVQMTDSIISGVTAVVLLGFAHMGWWMTAVAEVYTLSLCLIIAELLCLYYFLKERKACWGLALLAVNGAHFAVHNTALLALPVYAVVMGGYLHENFKGRFGVCLGMAGTWFLASSLIWWLAARMLLEPASIMDVISSTLFGDGYQGHVLGVAGFNSRLFLTNLALAGMSFLNPCWIFVLGGVLGSGLTQQRGFKWALAALTGIHLIFWIRYFVPDQATFILPLLGLLAVWAGVGSAALKSKLSARSSLGALVAMGLIVNLTAQYLLPVIAEKRLGDIKRARTLPGRRELMYWMQPWKCNERSAAAFTVKVKQQLGVDDILYADSTAAAPLMAESAQKGRELRFTLLSPWMRLDLNELEAAAKKERLYVVSAAKGYLPSGLLEGDYYFEKKGILYRVHKKD